MYSKLDITTENERRAARLNPPLPVVCMEIHTGLVCFFYFTALSVFFPSDCSSVLGSLSQVHAFLFGLSGRSSVPSLVVTASRHPNVS